MLIIIPNKCLYCKEDISHERHWSDGKIQMGCEVHGFDPFSIKATLSLCSIEHFMLWWQNNKDSFNVTYTGEEISEKAFKAYEKSPLFKDEDSGEVEKTNEDSV